MQQQQSDKKDPVAGCFEAGGQDYSQLRHRQNDSSAVQFQSARDRRGERRAPGCRDRLPLPLLRPATATHSSGGRGISLAGLGLSGVERSFR
eukprot:COSAG06_NODE_40096_length_405_cov_1.356209_1_plen_91_part_10